MSTTVKTLLIVFGILAVLVVACIGGGALIAYFAVDHESIDKARNEGLEFGKTTDNAGCDVRMVPMIKEIKLTEINRSVAAQSFFDACLETSKKTPGYCDGVANSFTDIFNDDKGKEVQCRKLGFVDSPTCRVVIDEKLDFCMGL